MDELISKQAAIDALDKRFDNIPMEQTTEILQLRRDLRQLPSAEPKRIRGKWVGADTQCGIACSVCGVAVDDFCYSIDYIDLDYKPNFCPNCGADMREVTT